MKCILSLCIALFLVGCGVNKVVVNREVDTKSGDKMLLGTQKVSQLQKEPYSEWYNKEFADYPIDKASISQLKKHRLNSYQILIFMGTWCPDSHREVPRMMKILKDLKYPENKIVLIGLNRKKESPSGEEGIYNIQRVPTFILKKFGNEVGRIIEFPKSGFLEKDLLEIIKKADQKSKIKN